MLKQINISHMEQLTSQLESALADGYTHFAPYANEIKIHQDMLKSVTLHPHPIVVDYTINGEYLNDCRYFGQAQVDFKTWSQILIIILTLFTIFQPLCIIYPRMSFITFLT